MISLLAAGLLAASSPGPLPSPTSAFVLADVLRVRAEPSESGAVVARLRIGTEVELREHREAWARVRVRAAGQEVEGWVPRALLGEARLTLADALARASAAEGAEAITWLERAAALEPGRADTWRALAGPLELAGRPDRARHARERFAGAVPGFLASCGALVAEWAPGAELRPLSREFVREGPDGPLPREGAAFRRELVRLADELPAAAWFRFGGEQLEGTPFPSPRLREDADGCDEHWLSLGVVLGPGCDPEERWLATTIPLAPLLAQPVPIDDRIRKALAARDAARLDHAEVRRVPGAPALLEVRFSGRSRKEGTFVAPGTGAEASAPKRIEGWALFGDSPEPLALEVLTADDPAAVPGSENPETAELELAAWSQVALKPGVRVAAVRYAYASGGPDGQSWSESGYFLVTVDEGGRVSVRKLKLEDLRPC